MLKIYIINKKNPLNEREFEYLLKFVQAEKKERILKQIKKENADNMLLGDILAKIAVKKAFGIDIADQSISYSMKKKPYLENYKNVYFNISHSYNRIACAVSDKPVGIDIEKIRKYNKSVAKRVCSKNELDKIEISVDKDDKFTQIWTKKEAVLKMSGSGIVGNSIKNCLKGKNVKSVKIGNYQLSYCISD